MTSDAVLHTLLNLVPSTTLLDELARRLAAAQGQPAAPAPSRATSAPRPAHARARRGRRRARKTRAPRGKQEEGAVDRPLKLVQRCAPQDSTCRRSPSSVQCRRMGRSASPRRRRCARNLPPISPTIRRHRGGTRRLIGLRSPSPSYCGSRPPTWPAGSGFARRRRRRHRSGDQLHPPPQPQHRCQPTDRAFRRLQRRCSCADDDRPSRLSELARPRQRTRDRQN
jgi:hypothetical protein